jgi:hypothetical protein
MHEPAFFRKTRVIFRNSLAAHAVAHLGERVALLSVSRPALPRDLP